MTSCRRYDVLDPPSLAKDRENGMEARPPRDGPRHDEPETAGHVGQTSADFFRLARAGDAVALGRLFERYLPHLRRWARGRLPSSARDLVDTDDLVQEIAIGTMRRIGEFEPNRPSALMAYLRSAILNRIRDEARRASRHPPGGEPASGELDPAGSPVEHAIGREMKGRYEAALGRLRPEDREAIVARVELGLSYEAVAEALDKPTAAAARMQVARALVRLAQSMGSP